MRLTRLLYAATILATLTACASSPQGPAFTPAPLPKSFGLRAGDLVRVRVWREPDLSGDFIVDEYGRVSLPLLGSREVLGESSETLQKKLQDAFGATLKEPSVQVLFMRRVGVEGEVKVPGLYPVDATMTVGDALALAGGRADLGEITPLELWRDGKLLFGSIPTSTFIGQLDTRAGDELRVPAGSWFRRNGITVATWIQVGVFVVLSAVQIAILTK